MLFFCTLEKGKSILKGSFTQKRKILSFAFLHISNLFIFHRTSQDKYFKMSRVLFPIMTTNPAKLLQKKTTMTLYIFVLNCKYPELLCWD